MTLARHALRRSFAAIVAAIGVFFLPCQPLLFAAPAYSNFKIKKCNGAPPVVQGSSPIVHTTNPTWSVDITNPSPGLMGTTMQFTSIAGTQAMYHMNGGVGMDGIDSSASARNLGAETTNGDSGGACAIPADTTGVGHSASSGMSGFGGALTYPVNATTCGAVVTEERIKYNASNLTPADNLFKNMSFSVEAWISSPRIQSAVDSPQLVNIFAYEPGSNINLTILDGTTPRFYMGTEAVLTGTAVPALLSSWHHIVFTFDASTFKRTIYVDGQMNAQDATALAGAYAETTTSASIGRGFGGTIDELRILNYALGPNTVAAHYWGLAWKFRPAGVSTFTYGSEQTTYGATSFTPFRDHGLGSSSPFPLEAGFVAEDTTENVTTLNLAVTLDQTNLTAPVMNASSVTAISNNSITWSWGSNYACDSPYTTYQTQLIDDGTAGTWAGNGAASSLAAAVAPNRAYGLSVKADYIDIGGSGLTVGPSVATLPIYATTYASVPGAPTASAASATSISVTVNNGTPANPASTEYEMWSSFNGASYILSSTYSTTSLRTISSLVRSSNYSFKTRAKNLAGIATTTSAASNLIVTQPNSPSGVTGTPNSAGCAKGELRWSWNAVTTGGNPASYEIGDGATYTNNGASLTFIQTGLSPGVTYTRYVRARDTAAAPYEYSSASSRVATTSPAAIEAPGTPTGISASLTSITWSWTSVINACSPTYNVYDSPGAALLGSTGVGVTSWSQSGLSANTLHAVQITATDAYDPGSPKSGVGLAYTLAAAPTAMTLSLAAVTTGSVTLGWSSSNPTYTRFVVTYSADGFLTTLTRVSLADNFTGTSIGIGGLQAETLYSFRVQAFNGRSSDIFGNIGTTILTGSVWTLLGTPAISGVAASSSQIDWSWSAVASAIGYRLYVAGGASFLSDTPGLSYSQTGLGINSMHGAEVEAYNSTGAGLRSLAAYTFTRAVDPVSPTITSVSSHSVSYSWGANGNPSDTFYEVDVAADPLFAAVVAMLTVNSTTASATGLFSDTPYYARLHSISGSQALGNFVAFSPTRTLIGPSITSIPAPPSPYVLPNGTVGQWHFDESTGASAADSSVYGNSAFLTCVAASCVSTPTFTAGPIGLGSAVSFSGLANGLVRVPDAAQYAFTDDLTVSAWVNPSSLAQQNGAGIVVRGNGTAENFALDVSGGLYRFMPKPGFVVSSTSPISAGTWTHLIGVYDSVARTATLYVNGRTVPAMTIAGVPARTAAAHDITIGNRQSVAAGYDRSFIGSIDTVRVQRRALTAAEALAEYQGSFVSTVTPPSPNNTVLIGLAPNAFGAPATLFVSVEPFTHPITITPAVLNAGLTVIPTGFALVPNSIIEVVPLVAGTQFTQTLGSEASISMPYSDADGNNVIDNSSPPMAASAIRVYTLNTTVNRWEALPTFVDPASRRVTFFTPHFSVFAMFAPHTIGTSLSEVRAYPIPWKPGTLGRFDAAGITFDRLPASGTIRILNLAGERVREFSFGGFASGSQTWNGLTDGGRRTASGVYFAHITGGDGSISLVKLAIER